MRGDEKGEGYFCLLRKNILVRPRKILQHSSCTVMFFVTLHQNDALLEVENKTTSGLYILFLFFDKLSKWLYRFTYHECGNNILPNLVTSINFFLNSYRYLWNIYIVQLFCEEIEKNLGVTKTLPRPYPNSIQYRVYLYSNTGLQALMFVVFSESTLISMSFLNQQHQ